MKRVNSMVAGLLLGLVSCLAQAQVAVLVHGYLGSADSWEQSGVNSVLVAEGWKRAGILRADPYGVELVPVIGDEGEDTLYQADLPSLAPMMLQAQLLQSMLRQVERLHPGEPVTLVAHSAGGVVSRIALVQGGVGQVQALVTIASPHLGTGRAIQALESSDTPWPFCLVQNFFTGGGTRLLRESRGALLDLVPAQPGSLLYWLNNQPHPDISYHAIVRGGPVGLGDELVPVFSQDMNGIPALRGRAGVTLVNSDHSLSPEDGVVLADILKRL